MSDLSAFSIKLAAWFNIGFAVFHLAFWRLFGWRALRGQVSRVNAGILEVLNIQMVLLFAGFGLVMLRHAGEMASLRLGREVLLVWALFWLLRTALQPIYFGLDTVFSRVLFGLFGLGALLHLLPVVLG